MDGDAHEGVLLKRLAAVVSVLLASGCAHHLVRRPAAPPSSVFIRDVSVLDVDTGTRAEHRDVVLAAGKIASITATGSGAPAAGARVIEGAGATLLPGLIDSHTHTAVGQGAPWDNPLPDPERNFECALYCGVTTVFDPGNLDGNVFRQREAIARRKILGPHLYAAGPVFTAPGGHPIILLRATAPRLLFGYLRRHLTREIARPEDAEPAVAALEKKKPDFIKIVADQLPEGTPQLDEARVRAIAEAAKKHGLRAVAHIGATEDAVASGRAGVSAWMHLVYRERIPDERIAELAAFRIPMVSTIVVFDAASRFTEHREPTRLEREIAPRKMLAAFNHPPDPEKDLRAKALVPWIRMLARHRTDWIDNIRRLHAAGVTILAGSDSQPGVFPGAGLHRELDFLVACGFTPAEAIRAATSDPARFLSKSDAPSFGRVAEGLRADLLLVDGDPTVDLSALSSIKAVFLEGVPLERTPIAN